MFIPKHTMIWSSTRRRDSADWLLFFLSRLFLPAASHSTRTKQRMNQSEMIDSAVLVANLISCDQAMARLDMV